jgi:N-formylglutamate deformylase
MEPFVFRAGTAPLLVTMPHVGTDVPGDLAARWTPAARALPDNDWHVDRLYDFLDALGASVLRAVHPRYVVDLNRPPDDQSLYPGQDTPGLVPIDTFARAPIYRAGEEPSADEIARRVARWWRPYHDRLRAALDDLLAKHGRAFLWEAHSIRSLVPRLFSGRLPDLNFGTGGGTSCAPARAARLVEIARRSRYSWVLDGRFKGGYTTRHYGEPRRNVEAIQLELAQITYMDEDASNRFREERAAELRPLLGELMTAFVA